MSRPVKRSFALDGHRTSVSLEEPFWRALKEVAAAEGVSLAGLVQRIDRQRGAAAETAGSNGGGLSGAIRLYLLAHFQRQARAGARPSE